MSYAAAAGLAPSAAALVTVFALGYVAGALLIDPHDTRATLSLAAVRLIAGLLLTTIAFLASLLFSLPWFAGPVAISIAALAVHGRGACVPPSLPRTLTWEGILAGILAAVAMAPIVISAIRMAPGDYPPVFFNVDTAYFLEKVHALVNADAFPPDSLGVLGGRRSYHFGTHALAAMIARSSRLAPHHALFLIVLPVLTAGVVAAAVVLARRIGPAVPRPIAVAMLLVPVPTLWYPFWDAIGPVMWDAVSSLDLGPIRSLLERYELWGAASNVAQNVAAHFIVLAALAGMDSASSRGWRLPVFLIGSAMIFKAPTGVALCAGFGLVQLYRAAAAGSFRPVMPLVAAAGVFAAVYGAFWILPPVPVEFEAQVFPLYHLRNLSARGDLPTFAADVAWLLLPALVALPAALNDPNKQGLPLLLFAAAPFVVVNALRSIDLRPGFGVDEDWVQVMMPVPLLLRAFALTVVGARWTRLAAGFRAAFLVVSALAVLPPIVVAANYSRLLIVEPTRGHEFVDNRPLAEALAAIPIENTVIVTNDLRYPTEDFARGGRQMQIPALFGHQAFAVNYAYEAYTFSRERIGLQKLLTSETWTDDIDRAARAHGWTHLLVRKDYVHPRPIPLERVFENDLYSVFRFRAD